ncbi:MAG: Fic family protein [Coriobacteriales bacterium]|jgi:Fic family protein|nr:Fic family protein [Coriobacteriales bacterium]
MRLPDFKLTPKIENLAIKIIDDLETMERVGDIDLLFKLRKAGRISSIHSSVSIEANSLSLLEVTDIINGRKVFGDPREIQEVKNAWDAYEDIGAYRPYVIEDFLRAHRKMSSKLVREAGRFRSVEVGVYKGFKLIHEGARPHEIVDLMQAAFAWGAKSTAHPLIKSCVIHFLIEYVHPFEDGNGRMGRLWQTVILADWLPIFQWIPVETMVYRNQYGYYDALGAAGKANDAAIFVSFMLEIIGFTLTEIIRSKTIPTYERRGETIALPYLPDFSAFNTGGLDHTDTSGNFTDKIENNTDKSSNFFDLSVINAERYENSTDKLERITDKAAISTDRPDNVINRRKNPPDEPPGSLGLAGLIPSFFTNRLTKTEKAFLFAIFPYLCEYGEINNYRAQTLTNKSAESVKKHLATLVRIGFLQAIGKNKSRVYRFADFSVSA